MKHPRTEIITNFIRKNRKKFTVKQIAERHKTTEDTVRGIIRRRGLHDDVKPDVPSQEVHVTKRKTKQEVTEQAKLETKLRVVARDHKETDRKYKALQDELEKTQRAMEQALELATYKPKIHKIVPQNANRGEATAFALLSDVHCEEIVPKHKVNYLNEHNPDISKRRVARFFELVVRFIRVERSESEIKNLVLWLGGDFFTSDMHGAPTAFPPMIACMYAQDMICSGLDFILEQEPNLNITIVGSVGNHSRKDVGKPVNQALEQEFSLEWMMYHAIRKIYEKHKNISFQLDNSYHTYVNVYDKVVRFNHGHLGWRYNDGLGGVHGPLWKVITQKWDKQIKADLTVCGHYHTYTPASRGRGYIVNGSTIGAAPYGIHFGFEDPSQAFFLIHNKYGVVGQRPLLVDT